MEGQRAQRGAADLAPVGHGTQRIEETLRELLPHARIARVDRDTTARKGELKAVFDPRGGAWMEGRYVPSILAAIGGVIERHMVATGSLAGEGLGLKSDPKAEVTELGAAAVARPRGPACPACGSTAVRKVENCLTCMDCGNSKCG